jgi:hypothetical protein
MDQKESCPTKTTLLAEWHAAAEIYAKAVGELSRKIGTISQIEYEGLKQNAEAARKRSFESQALLNAHLENHGCHGNEGENST